METIGLPKELYEKVTAICEIDAAFTLALMNVFDTDGIEKPYDADVKQRLSNLRREVDALLSEDSYAEYRDVVNELLYSDEYNEPIRIHELHYRFYKINN